MGSSAIQQQALARRRMKKKKPLKLLTLCVAIFSFTAAPKNCVVWSNITNSVKKSFYFVHCIKEFKNKLCHTSLLLSCEKTQCTFIKNRSLN